MSVDRAPPEEISPREADVLDALAAHLTNAEIAERLFISVRTVESHVSSLLRKLGASDRRELARLAGEREPSGTAGTPVPDALAEAASRGTFAGRDDELRQIESVFVRTVGEGRRHLLLLVGEAGIGKSRLLAEAGLALDDRAGAIGFGRCDAEALVPYQPFVEILEELEPFVPGDALDRVAPVLGALVPAFGAGPTGDADTLVPLDPSTARQQLFEAFERVLAALPQPLLFVIDDLQWADRSTLSLLRNLVRAARRSPLLVAASVRPEGLSPETPLAEVVSELESAEVVSQIDLGGLSVEGVESMVSHDFPATADLAAEAWQRTGGNPFLVRELLRHLAETGVTSIESVPPQLREIVARRVARQDARLVQVLTAGALAGESFRFGIVARAAGEDPLDLLGAVEAARLAGLITEVADQRDQYRFSHALVRDALVQRVASSRRLHLHLRLAEELERSGSEAARSRIAYHRHAALPEGDPRAAAAAASDAAERAMQGVGYAEAAELRSAAMDALELLGDRPASAEQRLARADALTRAGDAGAARRDLFAVAKYASETGDGVLLARAALGVGETGPVWGADPELVELLLAALDALADADAPLRARVRARLALARYYTAPPEVRAELSRLAEADARDSGDSEALAWVLLARHDAEWGPSGVEGRIETAGKILDLGHELDHRELQLRGYGLLVTDLLECGDAAGARAAAASHATLAETLNQPVHQRDVVLWRATWDLLEGRFEEFELASEEARELGKAAGIESADDIYWIQQGALVSERRDTATGALIDASERLVRERAHVPAWRAALSAVYVMGDDRPAATRTFDELAADGFASLPRDLVWLNAITWLADVCVYLGDARRARVLIAELEPFADRVAVVDRSIYCKGAVSGYLGRLAAVCDRDEDARRWLEAARARHEQMGAPLLRRRSEDALAALE
ncbi:MAG TPA: AAA family ATPase [Acidimicrobiia bacterium]